ncbi:ribonuclease H2 subunit B [Oratosquilla oratoria]|uniref:ribonuclease H2 subunit B n=1 Tax=Oratosquilla oratoria TaxID=337810 RepID=UPI003F7745F3
MRSQRKKATENEEEEEPSQCKQSVICMRDDLLQGSGAQVIKLRHPRTQMGASYLIDSDSTKLLELISFQETNRSWFIGENVQSDGRLFLTTPVDVTFLILPYLMKATQNVPLEQLLEDEDFPGVSKLASISAKKNLSHVADRKGQEELCVWRYNEQNTLSWLDSKTRKLAATLMEKKVPTSSAQALTYVKAMGLGQTQEDYLILAHGILAEYITTELSVLLRNHLGLPDPSLKKKSDGNLISPPPSKKMKTEGPLEDYSIKTTPVEKAKPVLTAKAKALAKAASGTKSITSFFTKK